VLLSEIYFWSPILLNLYICNQVLHCDLFQYTDDAPLMTVVEAAEELEMNADLMNFIFKLPNVNYSNSLLQFCYYLLFIKAFKMHVKLFCSSYISSHIFQRQISLKQDYANVFAHRVTFNITDRC